MGNLLAVCFSFKFSDSPSGVFFGFCKQIDEVRPFVFPLSLCH